MNSLFIALKWPNVYIGHSGTIRMHRRNCLGGDKCEQISPKDVFRRLKLSDYSLNNLLLALKCSNDYIGYSGTSRMLVNEWINAHIRNSEIVRIPRKKTIGTDKKRDFSPKHAFRTSLFFMNSLLKCTNDSCLY